MTVLIITIREFQKVIAIGGLALSRGLTLEGLAELIY